ncbi:iron-containing alcohol dehydrogenase [Candidatus Anaplasma sp. TIGMIC]|uniref:iron-containing alcohol dehydrogenase n=1 Tax=Candidatus Anaplasma sp. TIGMIC TaxID=3020713 RepID=UPI00232BF9E9|nr:iron-containing alcohol dehydrogenase [Candidatus Anaplasma sp. TIGMIC]MDB1135306.1 iron-containing alcohol dehydrogenase [Candidatus Anaplasma sp. TIGMIC]
MSTQFLNAALPHISSGGYAEVAEYVANSIHIGAGVLSNLTGIVAEYAKKGFIVADVNTSALLDTRVLRGFEHYVIQGEYFASEQLVRSVREKSKCADLIIALGSGSINDICKYAAYVDNKEYISFPTAPSMNGYASPTASITMDSGIKKSLVARLPKAIYIDVDVLANAPQRMINSGFADFICRSTARADWLMAHLLLGTPYDELPFLITDVSENALLEMYMGLKHRDREAIIVLIQALILSGIGMLIAGGSQPASQGEHIVAGATELLDNYSFFHGERVGVATVCMAKLQRNICSTLPRMHATLLCEGDIQKHFGGRYAEEFCNTLSKKYINAEKAECLNDVICAKWTEISDMIEPKILDSVRLTNALEYLGAPSMPEHMGWAAERYNSIANIAFATRDRFTFLDIAHHSGVFVA